MPEEFAAAYRAAYERALAEQSVPLAQGEHADRRHRQPWRRRVEEPADAEQPDDEQPDDELPERTRPLVIGTHRVSGDDLDEDDDRPGAYARVRDSWWFVPLLLLLIAVGLVVAAYVGGRAFASHVAPHAAAAVTSRPSR